MAKGSAGNGSFKPWVSPAGHRDALAPQQMKALINAIKAKFSPFNVCVTSNPTRNIFKKGVKCDTKSKKECKSPLAPCSWDGGRKNGFQCQDTCENVIDRAGMADMQKAAGTCAHEKPNQCDYIASGCLPGSLECHPLCPPLKGASAKDTHALLVRADPSTIYHPKTLKAKKQGCRVVLDRNTDINQMSMKDIHREVRYVDPIQYCVSVKVTSGKANPIVMGWSKVMDGASAFTTTFDTVNAECVERDSWGTSQLIKAPGSVTDQAQCLEACKAVPQDRCQFVAFTKKGGCKMFTTCRVYTAAQWSKRAMFRHGRALWDECPPKPCGPHTSGGCGCIYNGILKKTAHAFAGTISALDFKMKHAQLRIHKGKWTVASEKDVNSDNFDDNQLDNTLGHNCSIMAQGDSIIRQAVADLRFNVAKSAAATDKTG